jgi:hypothetical protein
VDKLPRIWGYVVRLSPGLGPDFAARPETTSRTRADTRLSEARLGMGRGGSRTAWVSYGGRHRIRRSTGELKVVGSSIQCQRFRFAEDHRAFGIHPVLGTLCPPATPRRGAT